MALSLPSWAKAQSTGHRVGERRRLRDVRVGGLSVWRGGGENWMVCAAAIERANLTAEDDSDVSDVS